MREELEVGFVRCVIKPLLSRYKDLTEKDFVLSEAEESGNLQTTQTASDAQFLMSLAFVEETLLSQSPKELAWLLLNYDCQPFSYAIVQTCLTLINKFSEAGAIYPALFQLFSSYQPLKQA